MSTSYSQLPGVMRDKISETIASSLGDSGELEDVNGALPTDWHLVPGLSPYVRVDGTLRECLELPQWPHRWETEEAQKYLEHLYGAKSADLSHVWRGKRFRLSVQTMLLQDGRLALGVKIRRVPQYLPLALRLPQGLIRCCNSRNGLIFVSGPTGSGKSTTLAKLIRENLPSGISVETYESPIEYEHRSTPEKLIVQHELGREFSSYSEAMRRVLRHDPDVIIPSEMVDPEVFKAALQVAETGHLVLGTLHLGDSPGVVNRVLVATQDTESGAGNGSGGTCRDQFAGSFLACLCQELVPLKAGGRIAAFELLLASGRTRAAIATSEGLELRQQLDAYVSSDGTRYGSFSLEHSLAVLLDLGKISEETAYGFAKRKDLFARKQDLVRQVRISNSIDLYELYK